jgi:uncharacterized OB-fold protein
VDRLGTVYTFVTVHRAFHPWFAQKVPYGVVVAEVGRIRLLGAMFGDEVAELECGMPVQAHIAAVGNGHVLEWERVASEVRPLA